MDFDQSRPTWVLPATLVSDVRGHTRADGLGRDGGGAERLTVRLKSPRPIRITHPVPATALFNEVTAECDVRATCPDWRLGLIVRYPNQVDPRTGRPLEVDIFGGLYKVARQWQRLSVDADDKAVAGRLRRLRAELGSRLPGGRLDVRGAVVIGVVLAVDEPPSRDVDLVMDSLRFGPIVSTETGGAGLRVRGDAPMRIRGGRATLGDQPFFPFMTPDNGDGALALAAAGINVAWVPDYRDRTRSDALREAGIAMTATPERVEAAGGNILPASAATPASFGPESADVLFWTLGVRVPGSQVETVQRYTSQVRAADRLYAQPRPIAADVVGSERAFSRRLSILGASVPMLHTSRGPRAYYEALRAARGQSLPGSLHTTWLPTEPAPAIVAARAAGTAVPVVEPEQIWMQAYLALAAGYRGLGFWKRTPLESDGLGAAERRLAIELLTTRLRPIAKWLAGSEPVDTVGVRIATADDDVARSGGRPHPHLFARVLRSEHGLLVLPVWADPDGQYVPGQMLARHAEVTVRGCTLARGYEVTSTGIRPIELHRVAGGSRFRLDSFDQHTVVLITGHQPLVRAIEREIVARKPRAGAAWVELATAKRDRVADVHEELTEVAPRRLQGGGARLLDASRAIERANARLEQGDYDAARRYSRIAMQHLRILQRAHWLAAVRDRGSASSSPHLISFQTLPDHWRLASRLDSGLTSQTLGGGRFEDAAATVDAGWRTVDVDRDDVRTRVELASSNSSRVTVVSATADDPDGRCLQLSAFPDAGYQSGKPGPSEIRGRTLVVESPPIDVRAGQAVRLTARVKVHGGRVTVADTLTGPMLSVPVPSRGTWERVELLREVPRGGALRLQIELHGTGEACVDDVEFAVTSPLSPPDFLGENVGDTPEGLAGSVPDAGSKRRLRLGGLDRLSGFSKFPFLKGDDSPDGPDGE